MEKQETCDRCHGEGEYSCNVKGCEFCPDMCERCKGTGYEPKAEVRS